jgi:hypothetical protein
VQLHREQVVLLNNDVTALENYQGFKFDVDNDEETVVRTWSRVLGIISRIEKNSTEAIFETVKKCLESCPTVSDCFQQRS